MNIPKTPRQLRTEYRYMFSSEHPVTCFRGWSSVFAQLCADIDRRLGADKHGFHWTQVREKFGSARFYYQFGNTVPDPRIELKGANGLLFLRLVSEKEVSRVKTSTEQAFDKLADDIAKLTVSAEQKTARICMACGKPGEIGFDGQYLPALCPEHDAQRRVTGDQPEQWYEEDPS